MGGVKRLRFKLHPVTAVAVVVAVVVFAVIGVFRLARGDVEAAPTPEQAVIQSDSLPEPGHGLAGLSGEATGTNASGSTGGQGMAGEGSDPIIVHVTGAVVRPGVVQLPPSARVADAVEAAGGLADKADIASVNLAEFVVDGSHIHVLEEGESGGPPASTAASGAAGVSPTGGGCVDVNTADANQLQELDGVGPKLAERILNHRETNGSFPSGDALTEVPGIGPVLVERIKVGICD